MNKSHINSTVLVKLILVFLGVAAPVVCIVLLFFWAFSEKDLPQEDKIFLSTQIQANSQLVADVEVRWLGESETAIGHTDEDGKVKIPIRSSEASRGRLSLYHPDYRPIIHLIDLDTVTFDGKTKDLGQLSIVQLIGSKEIDPKMLEEIADMHKQLRDLQQSYQSKIEQIDQKSEEEITDSEALEKITYEGELRLLKREASWLMDDSLLYVMREIDLETMQSNLERTRSAYGERSKKK